MEKVLDYEQDLGGPKKDPTRPMKAHPRPLDMSMLTDSMVFWDPSLTRILNEGDFD